MSFSIRFTLEGRALEGALYYGVTALEIGEHLPLELELARWGDAYAGDVGIPIAAGAHDDKRQRMLLGELAYWPAKNALYVFFGATPASTGADPLAPAEVIPIGRLRGDLAPLRALGATVRARLDRAPSVVLR